MRKLSASALSVTWFALAPGVVAGLVPWSLTGWRLHDVGPLTIPGRAAGALLVVAGAAVLLHAFARFVREGLGTPVPVAPPERLVVGGLYRYVRNPMYVAVLAAIVGQALVTGQLGLLGYAGIVAAVVAGFVHGYEEPALRRRFGDDYERYRAGVRRWLPRLRPWQPPQVTGPSGTAATPPPG